MRRVVVWTGWLTKWMWTLFNMDAMILLWSHVLPPLVVILSHQWFSVANCHTNGSVFTWVFPKILWQIYSCSSTCRTNGWISIFHRFCQRLLKILVLFLFIIFVSSHVSSEINYHWTNMKRDASRTFQV